MDANDDNDLLPREKGPTGETHAHTHGTTYRREGPADTAGAGGFPVSVTQVVSSLTSSTKRTFFL